MIWSSLVPLLVCLITLAHSQLPVTTTLAPGSTLPVPIPPIELQTPILPGPTADGVRRGGIHILGSSRGPEKPKTVKPPQQPDMFDPEDVLELPSTKITVGTLHHATQTKECSPEFTKRFLFLVNYLRSQHGAGPLYLSKNLTAQSRAWAEKQLDLDERANHHEPNTSDLVFRQITTDDFQQVHLFPDVVFDKWYLKSRDSESHSTLIWRSATKIGIGCAVGPYNCGAETMGAVVVNMDVPFNKTCLYRRNVLPNKNSPKFQQALADMLVPECMPAPSIFKVPQNDCPPDYIQNVLSTINLLRGDHSVPPLAYSEDISEYTQFRATYIAGRDLYVHEESNVNAYGADLIYKGTYDHVGNLTAQGYRPVQLWANVTYPYYNQEPKLSQVKKDDLASFVQLIWKNASYVGLGCATYYPVKGKQKDKTKSNLFLVANFDVEPKEGEFGKNVFPPIWEQLNNRTDNHLNDTCLLYDINSLTCGPTTTIVNTTVLPLLPEPKTTSFFSSYVFGTNSTA